MVEAQFSCVKMIIECRGGIEAFFVGLQDFLLAAIFILSLAFFLDFTYSFFFRRGLGSFSGS